LSAWSKIAVMAPSIWLVSTNVPEIMATPSMIATAVSADRSLRVIRPRRTTFLMTYARAEVTA
jgi:hypothetical protein